MRLEMTHDLGINLLGTKANKHWWFNQKWGSTQPINGHLTNHSGILGKSWKQGMFMGYIANNLIFGRVSNSGMPTKWGKWTDDASSFFFLQFFLSNHDNPTLPLPRRQVIQNPENPRKEAAGPEPPYINISLYLNTTYNPGYGWGKYNMSCNPARTIFNSIMSRAIEKHMLSASLTFAERLMIVT